MRVPKSLPAATALVERFALIDAELSRIEAVRTAAIVAANQVADEAGASLLVEREDLVTALGKWWPGAAPNLTKGKRKSIELAGCVIGSKSGRAKLALDCEEEPVIAAMAKLRWAKSLLQIKLSLRRTAILAALSGPRAGELGKLGFRIDDGTEMFYIERAAQDGTLPGLGGTA